MRLRVGEDDGPHCGPALRVLEVRRGCCSSPLASSSAALQAPVWVYTEGNVVLQLFWPGARTPICRVKGAPAPSASRPPVANTGRTLGHRSQPQSQSTAGAPLGPINVGGHRTKRWS